MTKETTTPENIEQQLNQLVYNTLAAASKPLVKGVELRNAAAVYPGCIFQTVCGILEGMFNKLTVAATSDGLLDSCSLDRCQ